MLKIPIEYRVNLFGFMKTDFLALYIQIHSEYKFLHTMDVRYFQENQKRVMRRGRLFLLQCQVCRYWIKYKSSIFAQRRSSYVLNKEKYTVCLSKKETGANTPISLKLILGII